MQAHPDLHTRVFHSTPSACTHRACTVTRALWRALPLTTTRRWWQQAQPAAALKCLTLTRRKVSQLALVDITNDAGI